MRVRVLERIQSAFPFVESDYGFTLIEKSYDSKSFGNVIVKYQSNDVSFIVCRDRFEFYSLFIPVNNAKVQYNDFSILEFLSQKKDYEKLTRSSQRSLRKFSKILRRHFLEIITLFKPENYEQFRIEIQKTLDEKKRVFLQRYGVK